jgi:hypothetical protein
VFLSKSLGGFESAERSLILFMCNVIQIVFMFAIWYQLEAALDRREALFYSLIVLATLGFPDRARFVVELQIATDFILLAVFLARLVGKVGIRAEEAKRTSAAADRSR